MPRYDYRCQACGHEFEAEQRITADALKDCPACKEPKLERLISRTSFALKGGGWYADAYSSTSSGSGSGSGIKSPLGSADNGEKIAAGIKKSESSE